MAENYQDLQTLQEDRDKSKGPGITSQMFQAIMMSRQVPEPPSRLTCILSSVCTAFIFIIIILVVTMTRQGVHQTEQSLDVKLKRMSNGVLRRLDQLYADNYQMTVKLKDFENFMNEFNKQDVTTKVTDILSLMNLFLSNEIAGSLSSDNQRILAAVQKITHGIRNKNGTVDSLCGSGWTHNAFNCYYLSRSARTWEYAKRNCEDKNSHLVVIKGQEEMNFVRNLSDSVTIWLGLWQKKNIWKWVDETSYNSNPKFWGDYEPRSLYSERCGLLGSEGKWVTSRCLRSFQYVCEKKIS